MKALVIGLGNPGRTDDGLGLALAEKVESWAIPEVSVSVDYQLNIEHAVEVSEAQVVIFVDASIDSPSPFSFYEAEPTEKIAFTTHAMEPGSILATSRDVYGKLPPAFILALAGEDFALGEELTSGARRNLEEAGKFLAGLLKPGDIAGRCQRAVAYEHGV